MAYTTIDNPELYFQTKLYTGNGSNGHAITFDGDENMQPDWVWIKDRGSNSHRLTDSVRGATKVLYSDLNFAEATDADTIQSFDTNGFTIDDDADTNGNGQNFVSWNWKAGGSASSNSDGTITSSVSANTTAGFSIGTFTGNATAGATIGHGLGTTPAWIICRTISAAKDWCIFHHKNTSAPQTDVLILNSTAATFDTNDRWNDTAPTSSVFTIGDSSQLNTSGGTCLFYAFAEKKGYSKFGSYTGNGNADGPFVYTGFKPAWVMFKGSSFSGENWDMYDNKRETFNVMDTTLKADSSGAESSNSLFNVDFLSNGIKLRNGHTGTNQSGSTYIYMAFAESPFVNSKGVPNNAR